MGVDPGQINIFTASDGHGNGNHEVRRYSAAEYYTRAGFKKTNEKILNMRNSNEEYMQAERAITTHKTADLARFGDYVRSVLTHIDVLLSFHDDRFTSLRFLNYIGRQRADAEMVNIFVSGDKKYLKKEVRCQSGDDGKKKSHRKRRKRNNKKSEKTRRKTRAMEESRLEREGSSHSIKMRRSR